MRTKMSMRLGKGMRRESLEINIEQGEEMKTGTSTKKSTIKKKSSPQVANVCNKNESPAPLLPKKRGEFNLDSPLAVQLFIARLVREVYAGKLEPSTGTKLTYMANVLLTAMESVMYGERLAKLEQRFAA